MHPLLTPTSHAELDILANNLSLAGYYDNHDEAYLKMFLGVTLGLTVLESLNGVTVNGRQCIVERILIERVIQRSGTYSFTLKRTDTTCELSFAQSGRKLGSVKLDQAEFNPPVSVDTLYDLALARGVRQYFLDLFGHKFYLKAELETKGVSVGGTTISEKVAQVKQQVPGLLSGNEVPPPDYVRKENERLLTNWQSYVEGLGADSASDWDEHAAKLAKLTFLSEADIKTNLEALKKHALTKGMGYNATTSRFYQLNRPRAMA
ncbi:hypothetical protein GCM10027592_29120 [Spirosoma flavus]